MIQNPKEQLPPAAPADAADHRGHIVSGRRAAQLPAEAVGIGGNVFFRVMQHGAMVRDLGNASIFRVFHQMQAAANPGGVA